jgi:hypothetical protein
MGNYDINSVCISGAFAWALFGSMALLYTRVSNRTCIWKTRAEFFQRIVVGQSWCVVVALVVHVRNRTLETELACTTTENCQFFLVAAVLWICAFIELIRILRDCTGACIPIKACFSGVAVTFQIIATIATGGAGLLCIMTLTTAIGFAAAFCFAIAFCVSTSRSSVLPISVPHAPQNRESAAETSHSSVLPVSDPQLALSVSMSA